MYSSELHRGVNDLISISARRILIFILALNRRMISILCFFCGRGEWSRSAAGEPFFIPFMTRGLVDSSHSHLPVRVFLPPSRRHSPFTKERRRVGCGMLAGSVATAPSSLWEYFRASTYFTYLCTFLCAPVKGGQPRQRAWTTAAAFKSPTLHSIRDFPPFASSPDSRHPVRKSRNRLEFLFCVALATAGFFCSR